MGSGGGGSTTQTTRNALPAWALPFARSLFGSAGADFLPGGQALPASQGIAGFSPDQLAAMQMTEQLSGVAPNAGQNYINFAAGPLSNRPMDPLPQGTPQPPHDQYGPRDVNVNQYGRSPAPASNRRAANQGTSK